jgi:hypothetical protein
MTPLGAVARGMIAGVAGSLAMDLAWFARYRRDGGHSRFLDWEFSAGLTWETAPAPAQVGKRLAEGFLQRDLPPGSAPVVNNVVHWATGLTWGALYGLLAGSARKPKVRWGLPFGAAVWANSYAVLPVAGLYKPIWEYDAKTLWKDLSAHLAYGAATSATFRVLAPSASR